MKPLELKKKIIESITNNILHSILSIENQLEDLDYQTEHEDKPNSMVVNNMHYYINRLKKQLELFKSCLKEGE